MRPRFGQRPPQHEGSAGGRGDRARVAWWLGWVLAGTALGAVAWVAWGVQSSTGPSIQRETATFMEERDDNPTDLPRQAIARVEEALETWKRKQEEEERILESLRTTSEQILKEITESKAEQKTSDSSDASCFSTRKFLGKNATHPVVDLVFTWVNGSDPLWIERHHQYICTDGTCDSSVRRPVVAVDSAEEADADARYRDRGTLRYSLRSIEQGGMLQWVRKVWIVTDGQSPSWLNTTNARIEIVDHTTIFGSHYSGSLPCFNSNAIELHLHKIPGLAPYYLYFNDDVLVGADRTRVTLDDFYVSCSHTEITPMDHCGVVLWHAGWILDSEVPQSSPWMKTMQYTNHVVVKRYGRPELPIRPLLHVPVFFSRAIMQELESNLHDEWKETSTHRFREGNDLFPSMLYTEYLLRTHKVTIPRLRDKIGEIPIGYMPLEQLEETIHRIETSSPLFVCVQEGDALPAEDVEKTAHVVEEWLERVYPTPSSFEMGSV